MMNCNTYMQRKALSVMKGKSNTHNVFYAESSTALMQKKMLTSSYVYTYSTV